MTKSFRKLHILITGANRGLGLALTRLLLKKGHTVTAVSRSIDNLSNIEGGDLRIIRSDLATEALSEVLHFIEMQELDVVINNAAILGKRLFVNSSASEQNEVINVNLEVPMNISRVFLKSISARQGGMLINVCSVAGLPEVQKLEGLASYSAAKAGLIAFSQTIAKETPEKVCKIIPLIIGTMKTDMLEEALPGYSEGLTPEQVAMDVANILERNTDIQTGTLYSVSDPA